MKEFVSLTIISFFFVCFIQVVQTATLFKLDFSKASGNVEDLFKYNGWKFIHNLDDMNPRFENGKFIIEAKTMIMVLY